MDSPTIRPALLTALCFLTFMSSISGLWSQSSSLWNPGVLAEQLKERFEAVYEQLPKQNQPKEEREMVEKMFESIISATTSENVGKISLIAVIFESLTLFAAYLIWNLDKRGFYLYLAAIAFMLFAPIILIGGLFGMVMAFQGIFLSIFMSLFYLGHLKYMH